ncbi:hypothetical protein [Glaciihabitans sp. UYNi722]|uniref:hypothetical protein n=1 Tax=Glaciihabitans sp. UYNi722 TaxID=3156344 RepID=UPI0033945248
MTDTDLTAIRARRAGITRPPWTYGDIESIAGGTVYDSIVTVASIFCDNYPTAPIRPMVTEFEADRNGEFIGHAPDDIDYLLALVADLTKQVADAWYEGWSAADINRPTSRKGHWDYETRKGFRTWIPDPLPVNPYRAARGEAKD